MLSGDPGVGYEKSGDNYQENADDKEQDFERYTAIVRVRDWYIEQLFGLLLLYLQANEVVSLLLGKDL